MTACTYDKLPICIPNTIIQRPWQCGRRRWYFLVLRSKHSRLKRRASRSLCAISSNIDSWQLDRSDRCSGPNPSLPFGAFSSSQFLYHFRITGLCPDILPARRPSSTQAAASPSDVDQRGPAWHHRGPSQRPPPHSKSGNLLVSLVSVPTRRGGTLSFDQSVSIVFGVLLGAHTESIRRKRLPIKISKEYARVLLTNRALSPR